MPTTAGTQAGFGVGLNTDIQVADRPVTQQGMRGMRTGSMGPGRQVADQSYYIGVLRNRVRSIDLVHKLSLIHISEPTRPY